jgi:hypothetical protein
MYYCIEKFYVVNPEKCVLKLTTSTLFKRIEHEQFAPIHATKPSTGHQNFSLTDSFELHKIQANELKFWHKKK